MCRGLGGGRRCSWCGSFHLAAQVEVDVGRLGDVISWQAHRSWCDGLRQMWRHENYQLRLAFLKSLAAEELSQNRNVAQARELGDGIVHVLIHQAGDTHGLAVREFDRGHGAPLTES